MECAVLFADVAGSTALYERLGDDRAFTLVESCLAIMADCTTEAQGRVVKTIGDAVLSVFGSANAAAGSAVAMQRQVEKLGTTAGTHLCLRIGFHFGPVVERDGDVFGDTVNLASRLCDLASREQIITDRDTAARLAGPRAGDLRTLFGIPVKGKAQEVELVEVVWQACAEGSTLIMKPGAAPSGGHALLMLELGDKHIEMGPQRRKVTLGRDLEADFTVRHPSVSRAHAMIERRRERFVLVDHSSNGTYVSFDDKPELVVHHEELTLVGQGCLALGEPRAKAAQVLHFHCRQEDA
jgi:hypothetical protein